MPGADGRSCAGGGDEWTSSIGGLKTSASGLDGEFGDLRVGCGSEESGPASTPSVTNVGPGYTVTCAPTSVVSNRIVTESIPHASLVVILVFPFRRALLRLRAFLQASGSRGTTAQMPCFLTLRQQIWSRVVYIEKPVTLMLQGLPITWSKVRRRRKSRRGRVACNS